MESKWPDIDSKIIELLTGVAAAAGSHSGETICVSDTEVLASSAAVETATNATIMIRQIAENSRKRMVGFFITSFSN